MVDNWPGRGFYRGNKNALLADTNRVLGIVATPPNDKRTPPEEGHDDAMRPTPKMPPGGIGTWVRPPSEQAALATALDEAGVLTPTKNAEMSAAAGMDIGATDIGPAKMSRSTAEAMGYTGDACDHCGSMKMQRTGHCNTCAECGTTTGCS